MSGWSWGQCIGGISPAQDVRGRVGKVSLGQAGQGPAAQCGVSEPNQDERKCPCRRGILVGEVGMMYWSLKALKSAST